MSGALKTVPEFKPTHFLDGLRAIRDRHHLVAIREGDPLQGTAVDLSDPVSADLAQGWAENLNEQGYNIYFHANPVRDGFTGTHAKKEDIVAGTHAQLDLDPPQDPGLDYELRRKQVQQAVNALAAATQPTVVIDSGNGFNILWKLDQPLDADAYEEKNAAMNRAYGAKGTYNIDRILKVPGTVAWSTQSKLKRGYPKCAQSRIAVRNDAAVTTFDVLPSAAGSSGAKASTTKDLEIPYPAFVSPTETTRLRRVVSGSARLADTLKPGRWGADRSKGLVSLARLCIEEGVDRLGFAALVRLADKSDQHGHVEDVGPGRQDRALGRAWQEAETLPGAEEFEALPGPNSVPKPKRVVDKDFVSGLLVDQKGLMTKTFPTRRAYVENLTLEGVRFLAGAQKMGKSWLMMQEAQTVATGGKDFLGLEVHRGRVLYCGFEDGDRRMKGRLDALGYSPCPDLKYWSEAVGGKTENLEVLVNMHSVFPFEVVYIDTLKMWLGMAETGRGGTAYDQSVEDIIPLMKFAQAKNVALVFSTHLKKDKRGLDDWQDQIQGSVGSLAAGSAITMLDRQRGSDDALLHRSGKDFDDEEDVPLRWGGLPQGWVLHGAGAATLGAYMGARQGSVRQKILDYLMANGRTDEAALGLAVGGERSRFYRVLTQLKSEGHVEVEELGNALTEKFVYLK